MLRRNGYLIASAMTLVMTATAAQSQEADPSGPADGLDREIVVTAQRREQSLQDVGIAVAVFSGDNLRALGLTKSTDIAQLTPGVFVSGSLGGQTQQFTIRGVTQSDFSDSVEAPVAVYIDDMYVPTQQGQMLALFDVERVEILKGPQGTLFGRNATGGLVNTVVVKPDTSAIGGYLDVGYGRFNEIKAEGAINLPLSSSVAVRASGYFNRIDNYWNNLYPAGVVPGAPQNYGPPGAQPTPCCEDEGGGRTYAGRVQLLLNPNDDLSIRLSGSGAKQNLSTAPYTSAAVIGTYDAQGRLIQSDRVSPTETRLAIGPSGANYTNFAVIPSAAFAFPYDGTRAPGATWFGYVPLDPKGLDLSADFARKRLNWAKTWTGSAHVDYSMGDIDLASITAYQHHSKNFMMDADGGPSNLFLFGTRADTKVFSQELRVSGGEQGFRWTAGAYYLDNTVNATQGLLGARGSILAAAFGLQAVGIDGNSVTRLHTKSLSGFGQAEIGLADKWSFIVGGRVIRERQDVDLQMNVYLNEDDYYIDSNIILFPYNQPFAEERKRTLWAGKAQLEFRPNDRLLIYAGVNRGVKGGSYNAPTLGVVVAPSQIGYDPEVLTSYEAGFKFGDRAFSFNVSSYYYDYKDYQSFLFTDASGFVQNVDSKVYGADFDAAVRLMDGLRATVSASYSHGKIKDYEIAPGVFRDVRPTYSPRKQASVGLNYAVPTDIFDGRLSFNAQANYASGFYANIRNFNSDWFAGRTLVNFSVNWTQEPSGLRVTAYLNNAFDKRYGMIGFNNVANCGCADESYGTPRTYGLSVGYKF